MSYSTSDGIELRVIKALCKHQRSSYSHRVLKALDTDPRGLLDLELDVHGYNSASRFADDYLLYSFLRKWTGFTADKKSLERKTADGWQAAEHQCFRTNERLRSDLTLGQAPLALINKVQRKIVSVIGASPPSDILEHCRWSGGATFDMRRGSLIQDKMCSDLTYTRDFAAYLPSLIDDLWRSVAGVPQETEGNRCVQVPKTAKINRMIAAEPTVNAFAQQSVGRYIRRRLRFHGVDLNDQSVNQRLAFEALVSQLATIDLSMASDTLSRALVELLLPPCWYDLLDALRSKKSYLNGKWYQLEKFSSMGNAFTFELESLIFWAITEAVADYHDLGTSKTVSVYGDDIICNQSVADDVVNALRYFGFSVNAEKSYFAGSKFFESCGRHFFNLENVTPVYQKSVVGSDLFELIALHNRLYRWFSRNSRSYASKILAMVTEFCVSEHPKLKKLPRTPLIEDDMGFIDSGLKPNRNGDYKCRVLLMKSVPQYNVVSKYELALYAYKLRRGPGFKNGTPEGYTADVVRESRVLTDTIIWGRLTSAEALA